MSAQDHLILINATYHLILAAKRFLTFHCSFDAIADDDDALYIIIIMMIMMMMVMMMTEKDDTGVRDMLLVSGDYH